MKRLATSLAALGLILGGLVIGAGPAAALGTTNVKCTYYDTSTGFSSTSDGGFTTNAGVCGTSKVRLLYRTYAGSPLYYTAWVYSSSTAFINPGTIVVAGNHGVSDPAGCCTNARDYNS